MKNFFPILVILGLLHCSSELNATTLTVTSLANSGTGSLRCVLQCAECGDTVVFAVHGKILLTNDWLTISKDVKILGPGISKLSIDGQQNTSIFNVESNVTASICNLTITNGYNGRASQFLGGGGINNDGNLTLKNCVITHCQGQIMAGGIQNAGTLCVEECLITDCLSYNAAGINSSGCLFLTRSTVTRCGAFNSGGGVAATGFTTVLESTLNNNSAEDGTGGGLFTRGTTILDRTTVSENRAFGFFDGSGGGISASGGVLLMTNSTVSGNQALGRDSAAGGGLFVINAEVRMDSCTIVSNIAFDGIVQTNPSPFAGGGISLNNASFLSLNTIIAGNLSAIYPDGTPSVGSDCFGTLTSQGFNLIQSLAGCTLTGDVATCLLNVDPRLGSLRNNGGPTKTHALLPSSPAIDQGGTLLAWDQRNFPRPVDIYGITNQFNGSDIGAFELQADCLAIEAERGFLKSPMQIGFDSKASQCKYIFSPIADCGTACYDLTIPAAGNYVIWCRVLAKNFKSDSFFVSMDGGPELIYDAAERIQTGTWQWTRVNGRTDGDSCVCLDPRIFPLTAGNHSLAFRGRDPDTKLDRILITRDMNYVPAITFEAELGVLTPPTTIESDSTASQGCCITSPQDGVGQAAFCLPIPATNQYWAWCRIKNSGDGSQAESFCVSLDEGPALIYDTDRKSTNLWQWVQLLTRNNWESGGSSPCVFNLDQGMHTLVFQNRKANCKLDEILLTADPCFVPSEDFEQTVTNQLAQGVANSDLTLWLCECDPCREMATYTVTCLPANGTLYQYAEGGRGPAVLAGDAVSDLLGRVIFAPATNTCCLNYASFDLIHDDGIAGPCASKTFLDIFAPPVCVDHWYVAPDRSQRFRFSGIPKTTYKVFQSTNLFQSSWVEQAAATEISSGLYEFTDPAAGPVRFFRVVWP